MRWAGSNGSGPNPTGSIVRWAGSNRPSDSLLWHECVLRLALCEPDPAGLINRLVPPSNPYRIKLKNFWFEGVFPRVQPDMHMIRTNSRQARLKDFG